jgi:predicted MPP superfamily phosphohydrolase
VAHGAAPGGQLEEPDFVRGAARWVLALAIPALMAAALAGDGFVSARADPTQRSAVMELPDWPAGAAPIKVALLSDIHIGNVVMDAARLRRILGQVEAAKPDLILLAGDFVVGQDATGIEARAAELTAPLSGLKAPLGTLAVLGNHDYWTDARRVGAALEAAGVTVLDNQAVRRGPILVAGVGDAFSGHDDVAAALRSGQGPSAPVVVLTHSPDLASRLPAGIHLLLAGHTHCGQIVLPLIGALPARSPHEHGRRIYDPRYRCGIIQDPGRTVIVTAGVGAGTVPVRIGAPPDFWLITLGP